MLLIKSTINFSVRTDLNIDELENLCIEIRKPNSRPFIVVNCYRPPNSPTGLFPHLENRIAKLDLTNIEFFLVGDMNADMASTNYDSNVRQLTNIADIYGLHQLISEPTRITDRSSMRVVQYTRTDTTGIGSCFSPRDPYDSYYSYGS